MYLQRERADKQLLSVSMQAGTGMESCTLLEAVLLLPGKLGHGPRKPGKLPGAPTWQVGETNSCHGSHSKGILEILPKCCRYVLSNASWGLDCCFRPQLCPPSKASALHNCVSSAQPNQYPRRYLDHCDAYLLPVCDVGARSLFYGSALGLGGVVLIGALALRIMDVRSPADLRERMQSTVQPLGDTVRESMSPVKESMQVRLSFWISIQPLGSKYHVFLALTQNLCTTILQQIRARQEQLSRI